MKKVCVLVMVAALAAAASAATVGVASVNWKQYVGAINDPVEPYGVVPASNWTNLQKVNTAIDLVLDGGAASTIDLVTTSPGGFGTAASGGVYDNTPMRAGVLVYAADTTITLSDLSATFVGPYDIIVYGAGFNGAVGGNQGSYSDGTTTYYMQRPVTPDATLIQSTDTNAGDGIDEGQYVRFSGLTGDVQTITVSTVNVNTGFGGIQVVGELVPEPATMALLGLGGLLLRRRK